MNVAALGRMLDTPETCERTHRALDRPVFEGALFSQHCIVAHRAQRFSEWLAREFPRVSHHVRRRGTQLKVVMCKGSWSVDARFDMLENLARVYCTIVLVHADVLVRSYVAASFESARHVVREVCGRCEMGPTRSPGSPLRRSSSVPHLAHVDRSQSMRPLRKRRSLLLLLQNRRRKPV